LICLGIESTAHTFSIGIVNDLGEILSIVSDTYTPESGGLHPQKVVEHHYECCDKILRRALQEAKISLNQVGLIAYSRGPGLGPVLRVGAAVARTLAVKLNLPIVGVNHCIAHVEIGRKICQVADPVTLYVSGGNTIVSAFESGRYQIFGETLDIPIGNLLDMVARNLNIPHPGGPRLEQLGKMGTHYESLPYIVKGMDLSFSGIYSTVRKLLKSRHLPDNSPDGESAVANLIYSLQETAFAMLIEVTERAIAHTEKKEVLLTGGVAANMRLQTMLRDVCQAHGAVFQVVPLRLAGDNGAMIAWTGIMQYRNVGGDPILTTALIPKWRMDEVEIPWRQPHAILDSISEKTPSYLPHLSDSELLLNSGYSGKIIRRGAEAVLFESRYHDFSAIIKYRVPKTYRIEGLDQSLRAKRTLQEVRTILSLAQADLPVPAILAVSPSQGMFIMKEIPGNRLKDLIPVLSMNDLSHLFEQVGEITGKIHQINFIHGDLTTSNIIVTPGHDLYFIDFGLAQQSTNIEDYAMDLHLFKRVLTSTHGPFYNLLYPAFLKGYRSISRNYEKILQQIEKIELRGRYIPKAKRRKIPLSENMVNFEDFEEFDENSDE
jgi:N6-L-threonylcarbamoyladenine synthase/protein kinase Bud32